MLTVIAAVVLIPLLIFVIVKLVKKADNSRKFTKSD